MSTLEQALERLPHGAAFRFIDRLLALEPGKKAQGEYLIRGDEPFLSGHFPNDPIFPGVLLIESIAQMAGVTAQSDPDRQPLLQLKLAAVKSARILRGARPGERLMVEAIVKGRLSGLIQAEGTVHCEGSLLARAEVTLAGIEPSAESS